MHRHHDDLDAGIPPLDEGQNLKAALLRHGQIEKHAIHRMAFELLHQLAAGVGDDRHVVVGLEQHGEAPSDELVVVHDGQGMRDRHRCLPVEPKRP